MDFDGERWAAARHWWRGTAAGAWWRATPAALQGVIVLVASAAAGTVLLRLWASPAPAATGPAAAPPVAIVTEPLVVHVAGRVAKPGVYRVPAGSRVADAIELAGGAAPGAVLERLNLARLLEDGEQLLVPGPDPPPGSGAFAGGAGGGASGLGSGGMRPDGKLDLNRATQAELDELPGIGPVLAQRILEWRAQHGGFRSVRDLRRVRGIGEKLYQSLAELVAV